MPMNKAQAAGQLRQGASAIGGFAVGLGVADAETMKLTLEALQQTTGLEPGMQIMIGAAICIAGFVFSYLAKEKRTGTGDGSK